MSGIGHLAPAFFAKPSNPKIPLLTLILAGMTNDILYFIFSTVGIEPKSTIAAMDFQAGVQYFSPVSNPWSHGLFMSIIWSLLAVAIAFFFYRNLRISIFFGIIVFSHWLLDFLMHSNLPIFFAGSPQIGLGLENSGIGFLFITILDVGLISSGIAYYFMSRRKNSLKNNSA